MNRIVGILSLLAFIGGILVAPSPAQAAITDAPITNVQPDECDGALVTYTLTGTPDGGESATLYGLAGANTLDTYSATLNPTDPNPNTIYLDG